MTDKIEIVFGDYQKATLFLVDKVWIQQQCRIKKTVGNSEPVTIETPVEIYYKALLIGYRDVIFQTKNYKYFKGIKSIL